MRLAYLHYLYGDDTAVNHVQQFAQAARGLGHRVDLYSMNLGPPPGEPAKRLLAARARQGLKRRLGRYLHEPKELLWNFRYLRRELGLLRANRPEVLLVRNHHLTVSCVPVARRLQLPLALEVNAPADESLMFLREYWHLPWIPHRLEGWKLRRADAVVTVSLALKDRLVSDHDLQASKVTAVPNGADLQAFHPRLTPDPEVPEGFRDGLVIGFVGSFQKWHGSEPLARMTQEVGAARPATRFLFVGDGPEARALRDATRGLEERVLFTGRVPHRRVPGLVAVLGIGVVASSAFYMSPLKLVEWMAAGLAVVAPGHGPVRELIDHEIHGLLFPPGDTEALIEAVVRLVDDPELRLKLGVAAAERAHSSFSWTDNARRVIVACGQAIERRRAAG